MWVPVITQPGELKKPMPVKVSAPLDGPSIIDLILGVIITGIRTGGSYGKEIDPIRKIFSNSIFRFSVQYTNQ